jgi:hypothetical protein
MTSTISFLPLSTCLSLSLSLPKFTCNGYYGYFMSLYCFRTVEKRRAKLVEVHANSHQDNNSLNHTLERERERERDPSSRLKPSSELRKMRTLRDVAVIFPIFLEMYYVFWPVRRK